MDFSMAKLSEWELWAIATKFDADFGDEAAIQAAFKADAMLERNDPVGYQAWLAIIDLIHRLDRDAPAVVH